MVQFSLAEMRALYRRSWASKECFWSSEGELTLA